MIEPQGLLALKYTLWVLFLKIAINVKDFWDQIVFITYEGLSDSLQALCFDLNDKSKVSSLFTIAL